MSNLFHKTFSVDCSLSRLLISLLATGVLSAIATGCGDTAPIPTNQIITEETATPSPTLAPSPTLGPSPTPGPSPTLAPSPTSQPISSSSKEDESALARALEDNISLMDKLWALDQELQVLINNLLAERFPGIQVDLVDESHLKYLRELPMSPGDRASDMYGTFIRGEVDRLKSEAKRLEESGLGYDYAFPESGFPVERKEDVLALAVTLRESVVIIETNKGHGTGFVIGDDLIITNDHVISDAYDIVIRTFAGEDFNAELVGTDPVWDIALLRSDRPMGSPSLAWGDSRKLNVKDGVFTIGHPGQMGDWALTAGVFVRSTTKPLDLENFGEVSEGDPGTSTIVETSVPSMLGISGSPLFNTNGEVIAVLWGGTSIEGLTDMDDIGSFSSPVPHRIHSVPAVVSREWTSGTPAWKVQELIEEWLTAKS